MRTSHYTGRGENQSIVRDTQGTCRVFTGQSPAVLVLDLVVTGDDFLVGPCFAKNVSAAKAPQEPGHNQSLRPLHRALQFERSAVLQQNDHWPPDLVAVDGPSGK